MTYLESADFFIYLTHFPAKVHSAVMPNPDGTFSMYLDETKSRFEQIPDYEHELDHIEDDDFYNDDDIRDIEK